MYITIPIKEKQKLTATYALGKRSTESIITFQGEKLKGVGLKENVATVDGLLVKSDIVQIDDDFFPLFKFICLHYHIYPKLKQKKNKN